MAWPRADRREARGAISSNPHSQTAKPTTDPIVNIRPGPDLIQIHWNPPELFQNSSPPASTVRPLVTAM